MASKKHDKTTHFAEATVAVHGTATAQPFGAVVPPLFHSSTYRFSSFEEMRRYSRGELPDAFFYSRYANPTVAEVERTIAELEKAEACVVTSSGLEDDPGHQLAKGQMTGFGGVVAIDLAGGEAEAERLFDAFKLVLTAPSLGGVETLVSYPLYSSHVGFSDEQLKAAGVSAATVRFAVGIEAADDIIADVEQALTHI